jgi:VWFA-related protein
MARTKSLAFTGLIAVALVMVLTPRARIALHAAAQAAGPTQTVPPLDADVTPLTSKNLVGHRLWIMLFDKSSMQIEDIRRAAADAVKWSAEKTPNVDVVLVAVISSTGLEVLQDFTTIDAKIQRALAEFNAAPVDAAATRLDAAAPEIDAMTNDARLNGLKTVCEALKPWPEKKEMLYFTSGMARGDAENQVQYREAVGTCEKAHVTIDAIDARGLMAGGQGAGRAGRSDTSALSTRGASGTNALAPRLEEPLSTRPDFSGTWQCDRCPASLLNAPAALWLGQTFKVGYAAAALSIQAARPDASWIFNLTGSPSVNHAAPPLAGDWVSTLSWDGDTLVLTMAGTVQKDGKAVPVVLKHMLSFNSADGPLKGDLQVVTTSAPSGLLPDGVCAYKKIG